MNNSKISRRNFLKAAGLGAMAWAGSGLNWLPGGVSQVQAAALAKGLGSAPAMDMEPFMPDAVVNIRAVKKTVQILPGAATQVWSYEGELVSGSGLTVQSVPGSYLGPIIRAQSGTKVRLNFKNLLDEVSVVHPHGLRVPEDCDGQPMQAIPPGATKVYDFQVIDRACPAWFHPHPMMRTAYQVLMGMAGLFYVTDGEEESAVPGASTGLNDLPVIIQDRVFDSNNQILYQPNPMWGYLGNRILVNGKPNAAFSLEPRGYRLRILNGSNARTYKLAWSNNMPLKVIGTDGGLLPAAVSKSYVMLMPGERVDVWADFSAQAGKQVVLRSLAFSAGGMMGGGGGMGGGGMGGGCMGGGGMTGSAPANGSAMDILTVNVGQKATTKPVLGPLPAFRMPFRTSQFSKTVPFTLAMQMMKWTINGRVYEEMATAEDEMVTLNEPICWEWINNSPIPHPMHLHNVQFQVLQRTPSTSSSYATINQGLVDSGWKDTVLVWPGERVKIAMNFAPYTGMYMYHCHILEHDDMGMMRNYMIMDSMM
jgi:FtsP/CotA-like multicopper oxidase with cupredoxin domain